MELQTNINILLAEDDINFGPFLKKYLEAKGYSTVLARNGEEALEAFHKGDFHLCISDIMMPVMDGFSFAKEIRKYDTSIPILFLSAKTLEEDRLKGFQVGADDYITKPFSIEELTLRIQAIIRRRRGGDNNKQTYKLNNITFEVNRQVLIGPDGEQHLTAKESELLKLLCQYVNEVVPRNIALKKIWNDDNIFNARSMDVYITKIRKYLKIDPKIELINVHGVGFKLVVSTLAD